MFKPQIKFNLVTILVLGLFLASCTKEEEAIDVENYGFVESYEIQKNLPYKYARQEVLHQGPIYERDNPPPSQFLYPKGQS